MANDREETGMRIIVWGAGGLVAGTLAALGVIGVLSEAHRAPDQP